MVIAVLAAALLSYLPGLALSSPRTAPRTAPGTSNAAHKPMAPHAHVRDAGRHIRAGQYARALVAIERGIAAHPRHMELLQMRATLLLEIRDFERALLAYQALLDAGLTGPNRRKVLATMRRLRRIANTGVAIESNVPASFYVDAKAFGAICEGTKRCQQARMPGVYRVIVEQPGFVPVRKRVRLRRNRVTAVAVHLEERQSPFTVDVYPSDAAVYVNGKPWNPAAASGSSSDLTEGLTAGSTSRQLPAGEHSLEVRRPGYFRHQATIRAHLGQPVAVRVIMDRRVPIAIMPPVVSPIAKPGAGATAGATTGATIELDGRAITLEDARVELVGDARRPATVGVLRLSSRQARRANEGRRTGDAGKAAGNHARQLLVRAPGYIDARVALPAEADPAWSLAASPSLASSLSSSGSASFEPITIMLTPLGLKPTQTATPTGRRWHKPVLISATGAAAAAGYGMAVHYTLEARQQRRLSERECTGDDALQTTCTSAGRAAQQRERTAARRANLAIAAGTMAAMGALWAGNLAQRPSSEGMPRGHKLSIAAAASIAAAGLGIGAVYSWRARSQRQQAAQECDGDGDCESAQAPLLEQADDDGYRAKLGLMTAGAAFTTAAALWLRTPTPTSRDRGDADRASVGVRVAPEVGVGYLGANVSWELP